MAKMEFNMPEDFMSGLLDSDFEEIAKEALEETAPELQQSVKTECASVIEDKTRNELVNSIQVWKGGAKRTKTDAFIIGVSFYGQASNKSKWKSSSNGRSRKTTNNDIAWWLEHGNRHQAAKPFIDRATGKVESKILRKMQEIYERMTGST